VGAALGAARLGLLAAQPGAQVASVCAPPRTIEDIAPERAWRDVLLPRFDRFRALYPPLRPLFRETTT
jgi:xylulokinase